MKIKYVFANGEVKWVEVSDEVAAAITESRRLEENADRKYRYHNYSLNISDFEGEEYLDDKTPEMILMDEEERAVIDEFITTLTEAQRRRLKLRMMGYSLQQISKIENTKFNTIKDCFVCIQKKFQTFFKNIPQK